MVTTHQYQLDFHGWIGEGYIIEDPRTGSGAYKIAGGGNGSAVRVALDWLLNVLTFIADGTVGILEHFKIEDLKQMANVFNNFGRLVGALGLGSFILELAFSDCHITVIISFLMFLALFIGVIIALTSALGPILTFIIRYISDIIAQKFIDFLVRKGC